MLQFNCLAKSAYQANTEISNQMEKYITVQDGDATGATEIKEYRVACHHERRPCVIITEHAEHAEITCDNWLSTDAGLITVEGRMRLEDQLQQLQKLYATTNIRFITSEVRASDIFNPIPLWYTFTQVPLNSAPVLAEKIYAIYDNALPHGK